MDMKNSSLISLHPPSLTALMQNNSRAVANNLIGQKTYPEMLINSASESSLNFCLSCTLGFKKKFLRQQYFIFVLSFWSWKVPVPS